MVSRECNKCKISKPTTEYYSREGTCKSCRKLRMKNLYHGVHDDAASDLDIISSLSDESQDENMQLHHEMEQMKIVIKQLHIDNATKDVCCTSGNA